MPAKKAKTVKKTVAKKTTKKTAAKKTTRKATAKKKTTAKKKKAAKPKAATKRLPPKLTLVDTVIKEPYTKTQIVTEICTQTGLTKREVSTVFDVLANTIERHIKKRGPGIFTMPGLFKIQVNKKPATKAREGVNPFTGELTTFKAKPARNVVKVRPLKRMKDMVA